MIMFLSTRHQSVKPTIGKLEKEGIIKEYTIIPDFEKLGYQMMALLFMGKQETMDKKKSEE